VTIEQHSLLSDDDLSQELGAARRQLAARIDDVLQFSTIFYERPWVSLDELLSEIRASATTVAVLEGLVARRT
jgi:hypothetical protein